jgi:hypothetical protein
MKTKFVVRQCLLLSFSSVILFSSCSKNKSDITSNSSSSPVKVETNSIPSAGKINTPAIVRITNGFDSTATGGGTVKFNVSPIELVTEISIYNSDFKSNSFIIDKQGHVILSLVPSGIYTVTIKYIIDGPTIESQGSVDINNVQITNGNITDLGDIVL